MNVNQWIDDDCGESPGLALFLSATTIVTGKLSLYSNALEPSTHFWEVSNGLGIVPGAEQLCDFGGFCPWHQQGFPVTLLGLPPRWGPETTRFPSRHLCVCPHCLRSDERLPHARVIFQWIGRWTVHIRGTGPSFGQAFSNLRRAFALQISRLLSQDLSIICICARVFLLLFWLLFWLLSGYCFV